MSVERPDRGEAAQAAVVAFLASPAAFGGAAPVEHVETHGAHVFLCGDEALKLKRGVCYDYMDLSTVALRRRMLERELELNRTAAPMIYRDVAPVTAGPDGPEIDGGGEVLDWVLRMWRFPAEDELEAVAARHALDGGLADEIGRMVAAYHADRPVREASGARLIGDILDELDRVLAEFDGAAGTGRIKGWRRAARTAFARVAPLLDRRAGEGHVRRGHGDLHLRNLVLIEGRPIPFDALEFDETLGACDVLYDLAFLVMDLCHRGLGAQAVRVLSSYLSATRGREDAGLAALPLFLSVRAAIRAMVLLQTDAARHRVAASAGEIAAYLDLALEVLRPAPPRLVAVGGLSGSGKTVLARALAPGIGPLPGAVLLSTDMERKAAAGIAPATAMPAAAYGDAARGGVYAALLARAEAILMSGRSVVLDGTFLAPERRAAVARLGVPVTGIWLAAAPGVLRARVAGRRGDASDADVTVLSRQLALETGQMDWHRLDASGSPEAVAAAARALLAAPAAREAGFQPSGAIRRS